MITISGHIISTSQEGKKTRVIYSLIGDGKIYETNCDDITGLAPEYVNQRAYFLEQKVNQPDAYQTMQFLFDSNIGSGTYDAVRVALKDLGGQYVTLGSSLQLNVTYPTQVNPEDVEGEMRKRVDAIQGSGTFDAVKNVLKAVGFDKTVIDRRSEIIL